MQIYVFWLILIAMSRRNLTYFFAASFYSASTLNFIEFRKKILAGFAEKLHTLLCFSST